MTENSTQDERWYRVEHRVSGFDAGFWLAAGDYAGKSVSNLLKALIGAPVPTNRRFFQ